MGPHPKIWLLEPKKRTRGDSKIKARFKLWNHCNESLTVSFTSALEATEVKRALQLSWKALMLNARALASHREGQEIRIHLAGVAQWIEHQPANQRVTGSIPSQGTCLGCRPDPQ